MNIPCFLVTKTGRMACWARRFADVGAGAQCPGRRSYHDAANYFGTVPADDNVRHEPGRSDPRWPTKCSNCDYAFTADDPYQFFDLALYAAADGAEYVVHPHSYPEAKIAPPGAMWFLDWCCGPKRGPGPFLYVQTPGGIWSIDGPANDGQYWTRTGTPPRVSVTPSILIEGRYHGFLTNGELVPC